jgi:hypothetical protein
MKKLLPLLTATLLMFSIPALAQEKSDEPTNCYLKWARLFEERGGMDVEDGIHEDIIITMRRGTKADCFNGKVEVKKGRITGIWMKYEGGSYEPLEKKYKHNDKNQVTSDIKSSSTSSSIKN